MTRPKKLLVTVALFFHGFLFAGGGASTTGGAPSVGVIDPALLEDPTPVAVLGQVIAREVELNGLRVPSGTTLLNRTVLKTTEVDRAVVHLTTGEVLEFAFSSTAYFERMPSGKTRVTVLAGSFTFINVRGELVEASVGNILSFPLPKEEVRRAATERAPMQRRAGQEALARRPEEGMQEEEELVAGRGGFGVPVLPVSSADTAMRPQGQVGGGMGAAAAARPAAGGLSQSFTSAVSMSPASLMSAAATVAAGREEKPASPVSPSGSGTP
ncbi:MAG: hypothetical protein HY645_04210 [Acidobacteria bacterium]|nr:hypothetical protein [Acidobacteriota bacterium]